MEYFFRKGSWLFLSFTFMLTALFTIKAFAVRSLKIAVVDTGVDLQNSEIKKFIKYSEDFTETTLLGEDRSGHGTHITGIIVKGLDPSLVEIYNLKFSDPLFQGDTLQTTIKALKRAIELKVDIVNYSAGGNSFSAEERALLFELAKNKTVIISAAGNNQTSLKERKYFPASYQLENVITVAAINENNQMASFSNFDPQTVSVAALGTDILSLIPFGQMQKMSGTSQATAMVTHQMALISLMGKNKFSGVQLLKILPFFSVKNSNLKKYVSEGRTLKSLHWPFTVKSSAQL